MKGGNLLDGRAALARVPSPSPQEFTMLGLARKLFNGNKKPGHKATFKPYLEALESREVMSVVHPPVAILSTAGTFENSSYTPAPTAAGLALINNLADTPVRSTALADYQRDGAITRNDMIDVFFSATNDYTYLLPGALSSVQTLVNHGSTVAMPDYVQNLSSKVIAGVSGLGQAPAQTLNQHVDNFFLGETHPNPGKYPTYTNPQTPDATGTYEPVNAPVWNAAHGPSSQDVKYTGAGDATLVRSLQDMAYRNPGEIMSMFINNGDGTFTVRFYNNTTHKPDYVTVDNSLPFKASNIVDSHGNSSGQVPVGGAAPQPYLWASLVEKAYAQENGLSYPALAQVSQATAWSEISGLAIQTSTGVTPNAIAASWSQKNFVVLTGNGTVVETSDPGEHHIVMFTGDFVVLNVPTASADWFSVAPVNSTGYILEIPPSEMSQFFKSWYAVPAVESAARATSAGNLTAPQEQALMAQGQLALQQDPSMGVVGRIHAAPVTSVHGTKAASV